MANPTRRTYFLCLFDSLSQYAWIPPLHHNLRAVRAGYSRGRNRPLFRARGGSVCNACVRHGEPVSKTALEGMRRMLVMEDSEMDRVKLSEQVRGNLPRAERILTESSLEFGKGAPYAREPAHPDAT